MLIAVDGTAASGKGTLARHLASRLNLRHLDTGSLYRGVGLSLLRAGFSDAEITTQIAENAAKNLDFALTEDAEIRTDAVGNLASVVAAMDPVRDALKTRQLDFTTAIPDGFDGAILDGRDIGTVILPHADFKFFVDAAPQIRAERRRAELQAQGAAADIDVVLEQLMVRDQRDMNRTIAPLKQADDAIFVDTGEKTVDEMVTFALSAIGR